MHDLLKYDDCLLWLLQHHDCDICHVNPVENNEDVFGKEIESHFTAADDRQQPLVVED